jgi:hypothetical protein
VGHCEYFATAGVLLLRNAGWPARYAVGYAVQERAGKGFIVRQRHAHAWCLVYYHGAWQDFDPTPAAWFEHEAAQASVFESLADAWSWVWFEFNKFRYGQSGLRRYLLWLIVPLFLLAVWRLFAGKQWHRFRPANLPASSPPQFPGRDSEFYLIEQTLAAQGIMRSADENLSAWLERIQSTPTMAATQIGLETLVRLHYRYRFDPNGLNPSERNDLRKQAESCLQAMNQNRPA